MASDLGADIAAVQGIAAVPRILEVVCRSTGMGFAAVARVTENRWICCAVRDEIAFGLTPGGELKLETTICHEIRQSGQAVVIDSVADDIAYCGHHTPAQYGFQSYVSMPIILADGSFFGTLCAIDPRPARLNTPQTVGMFKLFAELIATHLDAAHRVATSEARLLGERETSGAARAVHRRARARFAQSARIGRGGNAAIDAGRQRTCTDPGADAAERGADVGADRQCAGFRPWPPGQRDHPEPIPHALGPVLDHVIAELRSTYPDRPIEAEYALDRPVDCDSGRVAQLFSNLLGNALTHGSADSPVRVRATSNDREFELSIANSGTPIPQEAIERLFQPFYRASQDPGQGLGLGLYIASEIARAHGGRIDVTSSPQETRFTFRMQA